MEKAGIKTKTERKIWEDECLDQLGHINRKQTDLITQ